MRRKSKNPRCRRVSLNLTEAEFDTLHRAADAMGVSMTQVLVEGLEKVVASLKRNKGWTDTQDRKKRSEQKEIVARIIEDLRKKYL